MTIVVCKKIFYLSYETVSKSIFIEIVYMRGVTIKKSLSRSNRLNRLSRDKEPFKPL